MTFCFAGIKISQRYRTRRDIFNQLIILTDNISNEIKYYMKPLNITITEIYSNGLCPDLEFLKELSAFLEEGLDFPVAWKKAVMNSYIPFNSSEKRKIISLGTCLGRSDSEIQHKILDSYRSYFSLEAQKATKCADKYAVTLMVSFILVGAAVFILLI